MFIRRLDFCLILHLDKVAAINIRRKTQNHNNKPDSKKIMRTLLSGLITNLFKINGWQYVMNFDVGGLGKRPFKRFSFI